MSEAERLGKLLQQEQSKPIPDDDVIYALKIRLPYANTIDIDKVRCGSEKIDRLSALGYLTEIIGATHE